MIGRLRQSERIVRAGLVPLFVRERVVRSGLVPLFVLERIVRAGLVLSFVIGCAQGGDARSYRLLHSGSHWDGGEGGFDSSPPAYVQYRPQESLDESV